MKGCHHDFQGEVSLGTVAGIEKAFNAKGKENIKMGHSLADMINRMMTRMLSVDSHSNCRSHTR